MPELPVGQQVITVPSMVQWLFVFVLSVVAAVAAWGANRFVKNVDERFGDGEKRMDAHDEKISTVAEELACLRGEHLARRRGDVCSTTDQK
jgi:membrane protein implicated in regulation of membrane protease activity